MTFACVEIAPGSIYNHRVAYRLSPRTVNRAVLVERRACVLRSTSHVALVGRTMRERDARRDARCSGRTMSPPPPTVIDSTNLELAKV